MASVIKNILCGIMGIALLCIQSSVAQVLPDVQKSFTAYQSNNFQEKLYVHTNKSFYVTGEILWFKVYNVDGKYHKPNDLSKVAYIELLDNNHTPVLQTKIGLKNGIGNGSVYLPASVNNGHYLLRAYTSWMKNFGPEYFFEKQVTIVNTLKSPEAPLRQATVNYDVQLFPEGGNLVAGIPSKVAYKITGTNGKGAALAGAIINQRNDTVARFLPLKFGIGSFMFTPQAGDQYRAIIKAGSKPVVKELPAISNQGYVMQVTDQGNSWDITVQSTDKAGSASLYLFVHTRQAVKVAETIGLNNGSAHFQLDKNRLDQGISHITLFDNAKRPLCERLVFVRPTAKLLIEAKTSDAAYTTRKPVTLHITTQSQGGKLLPANLSVSVFRLDSLQQPDQADIASYIWLASELKGTIESPAYYLDNTGKEADEALDNLLLSQGWRRFDWSAVMAGKPASFKFLPEYTGHLITGKITNKLTGAPAKNINAYLGIPSTRVQMYPSVSDSTGRLLFETKDFYGLNEIIAQTNTMLDSTYRIEISSPFAEQYSSTAMPALTLNTGMQHDLETHNLNMQLQNVYAGPQLRQFYAPAVDSTAFYGQPDYSFLLDNYTRFTTVEEVMREFISSINVVKRQGKFHIKIFNATGMLPEEPLVILDGVPVFDNDKIFKLDPLKVKRIDVVPHQYFYGPAVMSGIVSYNTYKGDRNGFEIDPRAVVLDYEGLQQQRRFYSPVYDTPEQQSSRIPDFRNALYWQPDASTSAQGKSSLSFYTSDQAGKYIGIIQGISTSGEAGTKYFTFEVKSNTL